MFMLRVGAGGVGRTFASQHFLRFLDGAAGLTRLDEKSRHMCCERASSCGAS